jgi:hypothetical protein
MRYLRLVPGASILENSKSLRFRSQLRSVSVNRVVIGTMRILLPLRNPT